MAEAGFYVGSIVSNVSGNFAGQTAVANRTDGSYFYCQRKLEPLVHYKTWMDAYGAFNQELTVVTKMSLAERQHWVDEKFNCGDLKNLIAIDVVMDLANQSDCVFSETTVQTCFIARGFKKFSISTQK